MWIFSCLADVAAIATAAAAAFWTWWAWFDSRKKRKKLEDYLLQEKNNSTGYGRRTMIHLMSKLSLTEDEIFHAAFRSKHIECPIIVDRETNRAADLYFSYKN